MNCKQHEHAKQSAIYALRHWGSGTAVVWRRNVTVGVEYGYSLLTAVVGDMIAVDGGLAVVVEVVEAERVCFSNEQWVKEAYERLGQTLGTHAAHGRD